MRTVRPCTSRLHGLTFVRPAQKHVFVHIRCNVAHVEGASLTVFVGVEAEDPIDGTYDETLRAFLTYASVDGRRLAPFECAGEEEHALFGEIEERLALQRLLETGVTDR
jgi:acyl-CoA hydrolase